jgi:hypothetical protein
VPPIATSCGWTPDNRGTIRTTPGCGPVKSRIWNDDPYNTMTFQGGRQLASDPQLGQIIAVPPRPRIRSVIRPPCPALGLLAGPDGGTLVDTPRDFPCPPTMSVFLWNDSPGTLELTFKGGSREQRVGFESRSWSIPAGRRTTVKIPVNSAQAQLRLRTGWARAVGTQLSRAEFVSGTGRERLF